MSTVLRRTLLLVFALLLVSLAVVWFQRKPIARNYIDAELARRGVRGSYDLVELGPGRQRIEHLVLGDPAQPDLTADWAELRIAYRLGTPRIAEVRAGGVRLRGRIVDGTLSLGDLDRLMPAPSGAPFSLPDLRVVLQDARMRLDAPTGPVGLKLEGSGNLRNGFRGRLAAVAPHLAIGGCSLARTTAYVDLKIVDRSPALSGPVRTDTLDCPALALRTGHADMRITMALSGPLDAWSGDVRLALAAARYADIRLARIGGKLDFAGKAAGTHGMLQLTAASVAAPQGAGRDVSIDGDYAVAGDRLRFTGHAGAASARLADATIAQLRGIGGSAAGTPAGPLASALGTALANAARDARFDAQLALDSRTGGGTLTVSRMTLDSASGARLALGEGEGEGEGEGVLLRWPQADARIDGTLSIAGGGLPEGVIRLTQRMPGGPLTGEARFAPYAAGGARLTLAPVRFAALPDGARFDTRVTLDGPLADGRVEGLSLPVSGLVDTRGNFVVNRSCAPLDWRSVSAAGLVLRPARLGLCPVEGGALLVMTGGRLRGGAAIVAPRLAGRLGSSPVTLAASGARVKLGDGTLGLSDLAVRLGEPDSETRLDIGRLDGRIDGGALAGTFAALSGKIGAVPLLVSEGEGKWRLRNGILGLGAALRVDDEATPPRFQPLRSPDFVLVLANGEIAAGGTLVEPKNGSTVTKVTIDHRLSTGTGHAALDVPGITFDKALQPEELTHLTLGVVANVRGTVRGQGEIDWSPKGVTSNGVFRTDDTALAAAFGPVSGLTGEVRFTDLLALETAPGQVMRIGEANPGVAVNDGEIRYQLLAGQRVKVESGRWPFAGGELILDPDVIDMTAAERRLTFRVAGLDAGQFINKFEFDNLNATGKFDGVLPMVFDQHGGRIDGGYLKVREEGGTLSYIGDISNMDLNFFANIAFDALKSIRYKRLTIGLNGAIDGELVSDIRFDGVNQQGIEKGKGGLFEQILGRQFIFNIKITAPFRGLMTTAKSFYDPSILVRDALPPGAVPADDAVPAVPAVPADAPAATPGAGPVQPKESDPVP
ncbi:YdbH domain-containing protein [Sphingomonas sanxanigenens]|uniref:Uncharacterized protein n=1 Tax=Sphingomonas sanxanigenens DSM 19645 = NX02 TaxID=1123269 RepID=W0A5S1_9SPHN|nr:YdbH domain-containing protein [Sphingomonas sanxanigenens]AHE51827.1 hypothetical protein NX02_00290 [Sphingomonas sanxanigenens DSM 19645 = NX02]